MVQAGEFEVSMKLVMNLWDNTNNILYDITNAVSSLEITTSIEDNAGKCTFDLLNTENIVFHEGATVTVRLDSHNMFKGYVFVKSISNDLRIVSVTCYDALRYLRNKDTYVFEGLRSDQIFSKICDDFVIPYKVVNKSNYVCSPRSNDGVELYNIIKNALDDTLISTGSMYIIRDNFGTLEHVNVLSLDSGLLLGDASGLTDYTYDSSIDTDTYTQVKLYRDNEETGKRDIFIVNDTINGGKNLKRWGILQYYEKVDDNLNIAQIEDRARGILRLYNNAKRKLSLTSLGYPTITAGSIFTCKLRSMGDMTIDGKLVVQQCTHKIDGQVHTMELSAEVV